MEQEYTSTKMKIDLEQLMEFRLAVNSLESVLSYLDRTDPHTAPAFQSDWEYMKNARDLIKYLHRQHLEENKQEFSTTFSS